MNNDDKLKDELKVELEDEQECHRVTPAYNPSTIFITMVVMVIMRMNFMMSLRQR